MGLPSDAQCWALSMNILTVPTAIYSCSPSSEKCTYCKSLLIKASAKRRECKYKWSSHQPHTPTVAWNETEDGFRLIRSPFSTASEILETSACRFWGPSLWSLEQRWPTRGSVLTLTAFDSTQAWRIDCVHTEPPKKSPSVFGARTSACPPNDQ